MFPKQMFPAYMYVNLKYTFLPNKFWHFVRIGKSLRVVLEIIQLHTKYSTKALSKQ